MMQIRHSMFKKEEGCLQCGTKGTLHAHGHYCRYESPDGSQRFAVRRY
jgi:hypothetical protein